MDKDYNKIKHIIHGCKSRADSMKILSDLKLQPSLYTLFMSIINSKKYDTVYDIASMQKYIDEIIAIKYREDAYDYINYLNSNTTDPIQIKTFMRLAHIKPVRPQYITLKNIKQRNQENFVTKKCPHCSHISTKHRDTKYTICGYDDSGYDWEGCGCDWCFKCEKMLCKKWDHDDLYIIPNRFHDIHCCKKHAKRHGFKYPDDYCQCNNINVNRNTYLD